MNPVQTLKLSRAQLELSAITGHGHTRDDDISGDADSEWDDRQEVRATQHAEDQQKCTGSAGAHRELNTTTPPVQSKKSTVPRQDSVDSTHEDPTAALLSGMLFQQLSVCFCFVTDQGLVQGIDTMESTSACC
jgi:hypothetical protein